MTENGANSGAPRGDADGPLQPGTRFGKFDIKKRIGRGGYASVYHAFDTILHRDVAIKVLHRVGGVTDDMVRRGMVEAQLMCQLQHKNIVQVYDANITESGLLYLVMELLVGRTLWQILRQYERLAVEEACSVAIQIAEAVEVAHERGAIHRDLKPENVFVTEGNVVKVLDFGIAKVIHGAKGHTTRPDAIQGTVLYMSPEQIAGHKLTVRSDIYALGNIMFEMLYGKHPCLLKNPDADTLAVAWLQTYEVPPALDTIAPYCPRHIARIVSQSLSKRAESRYASMGELRGELEAGRSRFVADTEGGELEGRFRDLSGVNVSNEQASFESLLPGRFPWHSNAAPAARDAEQQPNPLPPSVAPVAAVFESSDAPPEAPEARPVATPAKDPSPIALQVLRREPPRTIGKPRRKRIPLPLMAAFWVMSMFGGFAVSVGLTKLYVEHRRQVAAVSSQQGEPTVTPTAAAAGLESSVAAEVAQTAAAPPSSSVQASASEAPSTVPSFGPSAEPWIGPSTKPAPARANPPKRMLFRENKNGASEVRLRALEEKLNKGTLGAKPAK